ncbi:venom acid phosphatase Acph-1 isoform X2 [Harpegnathos saltator]|uniref:venom acid phosphatase Acph-1 isoform X2 n=2 Tax=Harpegnathos saltator TaxID=610380 RepID=UPI00058B4F89|nr:venom acid phosphatase Acph-1 isoform X2 [Harpegnathos saltator]
MANIQIYFILLISCYIVFAKQPISLSEHGAKECKKTKLRFISLVFRHGDRTLDGEAKMTGKKRAFQFGQLLRKIYNHFLGDVYYPPNVHARSTALARTKMTLQLVLTALYPPIDKQIWSKTLTWQPSDTIYTRISEDGLLFPTVCKEYSQAYIKVLKSEEVVKQIAKFDDLMKQLSRPVGRNITGLYDLYTLYHILSIQVAMNLSLPDWSRSIFPNGRLFSAAMLQYRLYNYNDQLIRLNGGLLLHRMIEDMLGVINGSLPDRKINLFSAHDVNVVAVLRALGISHGMPTFTSGVIIELHEMNDQYFVKVVHYVGVPPVMKAVSIQGCDLLCPLEKFVHLTSARTATHEDPKCPLTINMY